MRPAALKFKKNTGGMPVFKIIVNQFLSKTCQYQLAVDAVQHNKRSLVDNPRSVANSYWMRAAMPHLDMANWRLNYGWKYRQQRDVGLKAP
jgi:hypothetical protein